MVGAAIDAHGPERVRAAVAGMPVEFPIVVDRSGALPSACGFQLVPAGILVDESGAVVYSSADDFDIGDPRVRATLEAFLDGDELPAEGRSGATDPQVLELFAEGARLHAAGNPERAVDTWRRALEVDPDNFLIRSQIWTVEHPERFWPHVDRDWQARQLLAEGYDGPLP